MGMCIATIDRDERAVGAANVPDIPARAELFAMFSETLKGP